MKMRRGRVGSGEWAISKGVDDSWADRSTSGCHGGDVFGRCAVGTVGLRICSSVPRLPFIASRFYFVEGWVDGQEELTSDGFLESDAVLHFLQPVETPPAPTSFRRSPKAVPLAAVACPNLAKITFRELYDRRCRSPGEVAVWKVQGKGGEREGVS